MCARACCTCTCDCLCTCLEREKVGNGKCILNFLYIVIYTKGMNQNSWKLMLLTSSCLVLDYYYWLNVILYLLLDNYWLQDRTTPNGIGCSWEDACTFNSCCGFKWSLVPAGNSLSLSLSLLNFSDYIFLDPKLNFSMPQDLDYLVCNFDVFIGT